MKIYLLTLLIFFVLQLASLVAKSLKTKNQSPYASNYLERLRKIKHLRNKLLNESGAGSTNNIAEHSTSGTGGNSTVNTGSSSSSSATAAGINANRSDPQFLKEDFTAYTQ